MNTGIDSENRRRLSSDLHVGVATLEARTGLILYDAPPTNPYTVNMLIRQPLSCKLWRMKYKPL